MEPRVKYVRLPRHKMVEKPDGPTIQTEYHPVACLVGGLVNGAPFVTYSVCSKKDHFNKRVARQIALGRFNIEKVPKINNRLMRKIKPYVDRFYQQLEQKSGS